MIKLKTIVSAVALFAAEVSGAATFTLGAGTGSEADGTYLNEAAAVSNYGSSGRYWLGGVLSTTDTYVIINWPALKDSLYGRTVDACSLFIKPTATVNNIDGLYACYQIRSGRDWVENQATWNNYKTSTAWSAAGAKNTTTDIFAAALDAKSEIAFTVGIYTSFDITAAARQWDGYDTSNCRGVVLKQYSGSDDTPIDLGSDDNATAGNRPKIKVVYHAGVDSGVAPRRRRDLIAAIRCYNLKPYVTTHMKEKP